LSIAQDLQQIVLAAIEIAFANDKITVEIVDIDFDSTFDLHNLAMQA